MSDGILSDLIGERVHVGGYYSRQREFNFDGIVRAITQDPLALVVEADDGLIKACAFEHYSFKRIAKTHMQELADAPKATTRVRGVKVGDTFRFKKPPPGWTSGNLLVVDKMPGYAAPEGWDYFPIELLDGEIELVDSTPDGNAARRHIGGSHVISWQPIYPDADVEECAGCRLQRRKAGDGYQYRDRAEGDWHS